MKEEGKLITLRFDGRKKDKDPYNTTCFDRIIELISSNPGITVAEMAVSLGIPERTLERRIRHLRAIGRIRHAGGPRSGHWEVLK